MNSYCILLENLHTFKKNIYNLGAHSFKTKPEIGKATHSQMI